MCKQSHHCCHFDFILYFFKIIYLHCYNQIEYVALFLGFLFDWFCTFHEDWMRIFKLTCNSSWGTELYFKTQYLVRLSPYHFFMFEVFVASLRALGSCELPCWAMERWNFGYWFSGLPLSSLPHPSGTPVITVLHSDQLLSASERTCGAWLTSCNMMPFASIILLQTGFYSSL